MNGNRGLDTTRCKQDKKTKKEGQIRLCQEISKRACTVLKKIDLRTDETTINWSQNDGKRKVWTWRETALRSACG